MIWLQSGDDKRVRPEELQDLYEQLSSQIIQIRKG